MDRQAVFERLDGRLLDWDSLQFNRWDFTNELISVRRAANSFYSDVAKSERSESERLLGSLSGQTGTLPMAAATSCRANVNHAVPAFGVLRRI